MSEEKRCEVCGWPLADSVLRGCVEGNCGYRPNENTDEYYRIKKRREELRKRDELIEAATKSARLAAYRECLEVCLANNDQSSDDIAQMIRALEIEK